MINALPTYEKTDAYFVVADIENTPDGEVIDIDTAWRNEYEEIEHFLCSTWAEWWEWIRAKARHDKRFRTIYAHNGGGWDWLSLADYLLTEGADERQSITATVAGSNMVTMRVKIERRFSINFCDSLQLLRSSLDKLSEQFLGRNKVDTGGLLPHEIKQRDIIRYYRYVQTDTVNLLETLERALEILREKVAPIENFATTIGSTAMRVFRTVGLTQPISIPWEPGVKDFLRKGYKGGRVECFNRGYFDSIRVFDINSLYPFAMVCSYVPISDRGEWVSQINDHAKCGVYEARYIQRNDSIPAVMLDSGRGSYSGTGVFFRPELDLLREVDPDAEIEVIRGYEFFDVDKVFQKFVSRLYQLRIDNPDTPLSLLCKYLLNSLYGKFGQNAIREKIVVVEKWQDLCDLLGESDNAKIRPLNDERCVFSMETETDVSFEHVGIAGTITSYARTVLYRGLLAAGNGLVYCDTDSVHCSDDFMDSLVDSAIGSYKMEFVGEGVYVGKKLYALRDAEGDEKVRCKGVSVGGRNGASLSFDDFVAISQGKEIRAEFMRPPSPKEVFAGKQSCSFTQRHRTVRIT